MKAGSSGLSRLSGWSDRKFIQKNQTDQKDQPTRQTNPGALREHRKPSSLSSHTSPKLARVLPPRNGTRAGLTAAVERAHSDRARSGSKGSERVPFLIYC